MIHFWEPLDQRMIMEIKRATWNSPNLLPGPLNLLKGAPLNSLIFKSQFATMNTTILAT